MMIDIIESRSNFEQYLEDHYPIEPIDAQTGELIEDLYQYSYPLLVIWVSYDKILLLTLNDIKVLKEFMELTDNEK